MENAQEGDYPMGAVSGPTNLAKQALSPLTNTLTVHEKFHAELNELLAELEHKLSVLLRPQEQTAEKANGGDTLAPPPRSDLVAGIDDSNQRLRRYAQRVRVLLERLEI